MLKTTYPIPIPVRMLKKKILRLIFIKYSPLNVGENLLSKQVSLKWSEFKFLMVCKPKDGLTEPFVDMR